MTRAAAMTPARAAGLAIAGLTLARLVFLWLSPLNLDTDEAQYWEWSRGFDFGYFSKPPLLAWIIGATTAACGNGEACIRSFAPLFYAGTAAAVFVFTRALYDARVAAWSAVAVATIPGVSFSAIIASTDVPLLLFWAWALVALVRLLRGGGAGSAVALGLAVGLASLAKYAGLYFVLCAALLVLVDPTARAALVGRRGVIAFAVLLAVLAPNLFWNLENGFATVRHTAALATSEARRFSLVGPLEFIAGQFGIFGPFFFGALLLLGARGLRGLSPAARLLACFVWPPLALMLALAVFSRANANWAAVSYVAATPWVVAALIASRWLRLTVAVHAFGAAVVSVLILSGLGIGLRPFGLRDPTDRLLGWSAFADQVEAATPPGATLLVDNRATAALLIYYLRGRGHDFAYWDYGGPVENYYQMSRPFRGEGGRPVILVAGTVAAPVILERFATRQLVTRIEVHQGPRGALIAQLWSVAGFRPG